MSDIHLKISQDIEENVPEEIDILVRLSRLGNFKAGSEWFEGSLSSQIGLFPVLAERADFLLEQGSYRQLHDLLDRATRKFKFPGNEALLLRLFKALANLHIDGNLNDALEEARVVWRRLPKQEPDPPGEVEIHMIEIYLRIIVAASQFSSWVRPEDTQPPWAAKSERRWSGFHTWCQTLTNHDRLWEAQKVMRLLLTVVPREDGMKLCEDFMEDIDESERHESELITDLSTANACTMYLVNQTVTADKSEVLPKVEAWSSLAHSLRDGLQVATTTATGTRATPAATPVTPTTAETTMLAKGRPFFESAVVDLEVKRFQGLQPESTSELYAELILGSQELSDLAVQADYSWKYYESKGAAVGPDDKHLNELSLLQGLQLQKKEDPLGYVAGLNRHLESLLEQDASENKKATLSENAKDLVRDSPAELRSFNTPLLKKDHLRIQVRSAELDNDEVWRSQAQKELAEYIEPPENRQTRLVIPLHSAAKWNDIYAARRALDAGDVNERAEDGSTALHFAVERSLSPNITTLLLEHGARPELCRYSDGYTPLHVLVNTSYRRDDAALRILNEFLAHNADFRLRTNDNGTVLGLAAQQNLAKVVQRLVGAGADVNDSPAHDNRSALNMASWFAHVETMKVLIDAGADVNYSAWTTQTPLLEIVCNNKGTPWVSADRYVEGLKLLLAHGADITARATGTDGYYTVLGRAVFNGNIGMVKVLMEEANADPVAQQPVRNGQPRSLLDVAAENKQWEILRYLEQRSVRRD